MRHRKNQGAEKSALTLTQDQLMPYIRRHREEWLNKWRARDRKYAEHVTQFKASGYNLNQFPAIHFLFVATQMSLMQELFKSLGIEDNDANMNAALDQFDAAIRDPAVVDQL